MSGLPREIMDYVKLKDRPSKLELGVAYGWPGDMLIKAPVEDGIQVWKVEYINRRQTGELLSYGTENTDAVAALLFGKADKADIDLECRVVATKKPMCNWRVKSEWDASTKFEIIKAAVKTVLAE